MTPLPALKSPGEVTVEMAPADGRLERRLAVVDPTAYLGWDALVAAHPEASFFHGAGWARTLVRTYGHRPAYFCQFVGSRLDEMLPVMEVASPVTGRRGVSLPFSDFCPLLKSGGSGDGRIHRSVLEHGRKRGWRYFECRSEVADWPGATPSLSFLGHVIDLAGGEETLFKRLDPAVRRGIRKANDAGLQIEFGTSVEAIATFYALHCRTRRRHGLPPQPFRFFENLARNLLEPGDGFVAIARLGNRPVSASVFLHKGRQALYKFGASDVGFQHLRPNNLVMWEGLKRCAAFGFEQLHLGRTSLGNEGLRRFKLGFGASEEKVEYCRYSFKEQAFVTDVDRAEGWFNAVFRLLPPPILRLAGRILYPHLS